MVQDGIAIEDASKKFGEAYINRPLQKQRQNSSVKGDGNTMKILVIGGTGNVGGEVVRQLQKRKADLRLLVRKDSEATPNGVEVAVGDLLDPVSIRAALQGVEKLYLLNAVSPDELTQGLVAYDLAKKLKVKHVVYHSVFRILPRSSRWKARYATSAFHSR
jgi:uncharacterized protein YbjT (DUF2867 family)